MDDKTGCQSSFKLGRTQIGSAVAGGFNQLVALKSDGSLWSWTLNNDERVAIVAALKRCRRVPNELGFATTGSGSVAGRSKVWP